MVGASAGNRRFDETMAGLTFDVEGPNGTAHVDGAMIMTGGQWEPEKMTVTFSDGTEIVIPQSAAQESLD